MEINILNRQNTVLNKFIAEIRDRRIQCDSMRFRRNLERIGELMAYEISKRFRYTPRTVETPLGEAEVELYDNEIVIATILRAGLPFHQGFLNYFDDAQNAFVSAYRKSKKDGTFTVKVEYIFERKSRREDDAAGRPDARHRIVGGAGLRSARREGRYAGPHPRGVDHRFGAGRRLRAAPHAACDHFALVRRRGRRADLALLHRSRYRRCGRSGLRREVVTAAAPERTAGGAHRRRPLPASSGRIEKNMKRFIENRPSSDTARRPLPPLAGNLLFLGALFAMSLLVMAIEKPLFLLWYHAQAAEASAAELALVVWNGLKLDQTVAGYITALPLLVVLAALWIPGAWSRSVLKGYLLRHRRRLHHRVLPTVRTYVRTVRNVRTVPSYRRTYVTVTVVRT